jgi:RNA ligase (TIGR02306 family)
MIELAYVGKIIDIQDIPDSDFISSATVICGKGGKWKGVVKKEDFNLGDLCTVYLPDAIVHPDNPDSLFLKGGRVRMRRFRGAPSEVLITPLSDTRLDIGTDLTESLRVTKYFKPLPSNMQGRALGPFPSFIPKTDELNYQRHFDLVESLHGKPYYITEKADGASTTAFRYKGEFGVCSRNWQLAYAHNNGYWEVARKHKVEERLPEGYAIQWETCGPNIQKNRMGFTGLDGLMFSAYNIEEHRYLEMSEILDLSKEISFPMVKVLDVGLEFNKDKVETLGEGKYQASGQEREGVVIRSQNNLIQGHSPISFKVINLNYET